MKLIYFSCLELDKVLNYINKTLEMSKLPLILLKQIIDKYLSLGPIFI